MSTERTDAGDAAGRREAAAGGRGGYAMWVAWIEAFRRGENRDTTGLPPIDGCLGSYVEARLLERLSVGFSERVRHWQTVLGARIVAAPPTDDAAVAALLREAGADLEPLARVAGSPLVPRSMSLAMHDLLGQVRAGARDAVEESARRGREPEHQARLPRVPRPSANGPVPAQRTANGAPGTRRPGPAVTPGASPVVPTARVRHQPH